MQISIRRIVLVLVLLVCIACAGLFYWCFAFRAFDTDDVSYLFQARLFAAGRLFAEAPPEPGFSPSENINIADGKWYSKYPFGHALMLTPGVLIGLPWLIPVLLTGISIYLLYRITEEAYGPRVALGAAVLGALSPATLGLGITYFSEPVNRFFLAGFTLALFSSLKHLTGSPEHPRKGIVLAALSGFCLGYAFNTRTITSIVFGLCGGGLSLWWALRAANKKCLPAAAVFFLSCFIVMLSLFLGWNKLLTGNPFQPTFAAVQPFERLGFGPRGKGTALGLEDTEEFSLTSSLKRTWQNVIPLTGYAAAGWGYFHPKPYGPFHTKLVRTGMFVEGTPHHRWIRLVYGTRPPDKVFIELLRNNQREGRLIVDRVYLPNLDLGETELHLRITKERDKFRAFFRSTDDKWWTEVGETRITLLPPLRVGMYSNVASLRGSLELDYDYFRVNSAKGADMFTVSSAKEAELFSDDFSSAGYELDPRWQWARGIPASKEITDRGTLHVEVAGINNRWNREEGQRLFQVVNTPAFDVETKFDIVRTNRALSLLWVPALLPLLIAILPVLHPSRNRFDVFFLMTFVLSLAAYSFWWFDSSDRNISPFHVRYYNEAIFLGLMPLIARGGALILGFIRLRGSRLLNTATGLLLTVLLTNTIASHVWMAERYCQMGDRFIGLKLEDIEKQSVIFVKNSLNIPLGDYPFEPLDQAELVYFRLGPSRLWGLPEREWSEVYEQHFQGRKAYLYDRVLRTLIPLLETSS